MNAARSEGERRRLRHDLRAPLTIVTGFAELLATDRPCSDAARRQHATRIQIAAEELRVMLDDLLEDSPAG